MPVKRNKVQELLKERQVAIQQGSFILQRNADAPVEVVIDETPRGMFTVSEDPSLTNEQFYAIVDRDIKGYGYFQGDRQYVEGGKFVASNAELFDEWFGPDRAGFDKPVTDLKDVMPTATSKTENRKVGGLWEVPEDLTDPRSDFEKDTAYWTQLLRFLWAVDGNDPNGLFGILYGLRCEGSVGLEPNPKGGVKVFSRNDWAWKKAREEIMENKTWALNLNKFLGQVVP